MARKKKLRELIKQKKIKGIKQGLGNNGQVYEEGNQGFGGGKLGNHGQVYKEGNQEITTKFRRREICQEFQVKNRTT